MVYGQKISIREMAESLGISENTIKSRLFQGRKKLLARKEDFRKLGIEISIIPVSVLISVAFNEEVYASVAMAAGGAMAGAGLGAAAGNATETAITAAASVTETAVSTGAVSASAGASSGLGAAAVTGGTASAGTATSASAAGIGTAAAGGAATSAVAGTAAASTGAGSVAAAAGLSIGAKAAIGGIAAAVAIGGGVVVTHSLGSKTPAESAETTAYVEETEPQTIAQTIEETSPMTETAEHADVSGNYIGSDGNLVLAENGDTLSVTGYLPSGVDDEGYIIYDNITAEFSRDSISPTPKVYNGYSYTFGPWHWDIIDIFFSGDYAMLRFAGETDEGPSEIFVREGSPAAETEPHEIDIEADISYLSEVEEYTDLYFYGEDAGGYVEAADGNGELINSFDDSGRLIQKTGSIWDYAGNTVVDDVSIYYDTEPNSDGIRMPLSIYGTYTWNDQWFEILLDRDTGRIISYRDNSGSAAEEYPLGISVNQLFTERFDTGYVLREAFRDVEGIGYWETVGWTTFEKAENYEDEMMSPDYGESAEDIPSSNQEDSNESASDVGAESASGDNMGTAEAQGPYMFLSTGSALDSVMNTYGYTDYYVEYYYSYPDDYTGNVVAGTPAYIYIVVNGNDYGYYFSNGTLSRRVDFTQGITSDDVPINDFISQVYQAGF